jgi:hypothetical protein
LRDHGARKPPYRHSVIESDATVQLNRSFHFRQCLFRVNSTSLATSAFRLMIIRKLPQPE